MRKYFNIDLKTKSIETEELIGEDIARAGRYRIAKTLVDRGLAAIDPLSPENPFVISAGPFAGSNFSNGNRISVGCKSPLTGGIKESNGGGTMAFAMGQLGIAGMTLNNASDDWVVIRISLDGSITFEDATPYMGKGVFEAAKLLHEKYGDKVSLGITSPVAEYGGLLGGVVFTDPEGRPTRICARGGVGAVLASKKVKAIVCDKNKMPDFHDRKKFMQSLKVYGNKIKDDPATQNLGARGTAMVADVINHLGGLPVANFRQGAQVDTSKGEVLKIGGDFIREQNIARGGEPTHACMPGCLIRCSNVYHDEDGKELVAPIEYETIGLMGSNCGLTHPDQIARVNAVANDLAIDTIETGALLGAMMDAGLGPYGDENFMLEALADIRDGNERGKILAQGTARVGEHYGITRLPIIKKQAISAYDPRVIEVTGISMMLTAQGADHTTGNLPAFECTGKSTEELALESLNIQAKCAAVDSLGICVFGRSVHNAEPELIIDAINDAHGTDLKPEFFDRLGKETLALEEQFNKAAGFGVEDDELPDFFYQEPLAPTMKMARHHAHEVNQIRNRWFGN
ncbi:MAG: aldehyde ferredoxin oxidoreductase C-terminal domain-containing protein [Rhodospirillaceae bacterium]